MKRDYVLRRQVVGSLCKHLSQLSPATKQPWALKNSAIAQHKLSSDRTTNCFLQVLIWKKLEGLKRWETTPVWPGQECGFVSIAAANWKAELESETKLASPTRWGGIWPWSLVAPSPMQPISPKTSGTGLTHPYHHHYLHLLLSLPESAQLIPALLFEAMKPSVLLGCLLSPERRRTPHLSLSATLFSPASLLYSLFSKSSNSHNLLIHFLSRFFSVAKNFRHSSQKILLSESKSSSHVADFLSSYCQFFPLTKFQHLGFVSSANETRTESRQISKLKLGSKNSLSLKFKIQRRQQQQQQQRDDNNPRKKEICSVLLVRNRTKPVTRESAKHFAYSPPANEHKQKNRKEEEAGERPWLRR